MRLSLFLFAFLPLFAKESLTPLIAPPDSMIAMSQTADIPTSRNVMIEGPWFTGPLLTPSPMIVLPGYYNIEPYIFYDNNIGFYDTNWSSHSLNTTSGFVNFLASIEIGLLPFMDIAIYPQFRYNFNDDASTWCFEDFSVLLSFQLSHFKINSWVPCARFSIGESFPSGKYQHLNPAKKKTDIGGDGIFNTTFYMLLGHLWHFGGCHYLADRIAIGLGIPSNVHVSGFNFYGGNSKTEGTIYPGIEQSLYLGFEYNLTENWALALDLASQFQACTSFKGNTGGAVIGFDSYSYAFSLAPAIEYNFNAYAGIIAGVWFTAAGHNTPNFVNAMIAFNFLFS